MKTRTKRISIMFLVLLLTFSCVATVYAVESGSDGDRVESGSNGVESDSNGRESGSNGDRTDTPGGGSVPPGGVITDSAQAAEKIENTPSGGSADIGTVAPGTVIGSDVWNIAIKNELSITLSSDAGVKVTWTFGTISNNVPFDPAVYIDKNVDTVKAALSKGVFPDSLRYTTVTFAHEGLLPGKANVILDLSSVNVFTDGETLYLYYLNPATGKFELVDISTYRDGLVGFTMTHCSDYLIANQALPGTITASPKTGEFAGTTGVCLLLAAAAGVMIFLYRCKKQAR